MLWREGCALDGLCLQGLEERLDWWNESSADRGELGLYAGDGGSFGGLFGRCGGWLVFLANDSNGAAVAQAVCRDC